MPVNGHYTFEETDNILGKMLEYLDKEMGNNIVSVGLAFNKVHPVYIECASEDSARAVLQFLEEKVENITGQVAQSERNNKNLGLTSEGLNKLMDHISPIQDETPSSNTSPSA